MSPSQIWNDLRAWWHQRKERKAAKVAPPKGAAKPRAKAPPPPPPPKAPEPPPPIASAYEPPPPTPTPALGELEVMKAKYDSKILKDEQERERKEWNKRFREQQAEKNAPVIARLKELAEKAEKERAVREEKEQRRQAARDEALERVFKVAVRMEKWLDDQEKVK